MAKMASRGEEKLTPVVVERKTTVASGGGGGRVEITLDNTPDEALQYDQEGRILDFSDDVEKFLYLSHDVVQGLGADNRQRYLLAYASWKYATDHADEDLPSGLSISGRFATATARLSVNQSPQFQKAYSLAWRRSDEVQGALQEGYSLVKPGEVSSFGKTPSGMHRVGAGGETELVLMKMPRGMWEQRQRAIGEKSTGRVVNLEAATAAEMQKDGGSPVLLSQKES